MDHACFINRQVWQNSKDAAIVYGLIPELSYLCLL